MVFLTKSSGYHFVKLNGRPIKNQSYNIYMNKGNKNVKNGKNNERVIINTDENNKKYSRNFNSLANFFDVLNKNDGSIFNVTRNYHHKKPCKFRQNIPQKNTQKNKKNKSYSPPKKNTRNNNKKKNNSI